MQANSNCMQTRRETADCKRRVALHSPCYLLALQRRLQYPRRDRHAYRHDNLCGRAGGGNRGAGARPSGTEVGLGKRGGLPVKKNAGKGTVRQSSPNPIFTRHWAQVPRVSDMLLAAGRADGAKGRERAQRDAPMPSLTDSVLRMMSFSPAVWAILAKL